MSVKLLTNILYDAIIVIIILFIVIYLILPLFFQDTELSRLKKSLEAVCKKDNTFRDFRISLEKYDVLFTKNPDGYKVSILLCKDYRINNSVRYMGDCKVIYKIDCSNVKNVELKSENIKIKNFIEKGVCYDIVPKISPLSMFIISIVPIPIERPKYVSSDNFIQKETFALGDYCYIDYCKYDDCGWGRDILTKEIAGVFVRQDKTLYIEIDSAR